MNRIDRICAKIEKIESLLLEVKADIKALKQGKELQNKKSKKNKEVPSPENLRSDFETLYEKFINGDTKIVQDVVSSKDVVYLKEFCKVNNIALDRTKRSKENIANEIVQWFLQRKAITKRVKQV